VAYYNSEMGGMESFSHDNIWAKPILKASSLSL
jgi:hypothetical protein